jgi:hypothetical protein
LLNRGWIADIRGALTMGALTDYLHLLNSLSSMVLQPNIDDQHIFSVAPVGQYFASSTYNGLLFGPILFEHHQRISKSWAPLNAILFVVGGPE